MMSFIIALAGCGATPRGTKYVEPYPTNEKNSIQQKKLVKIKKLSALGQKKESSKLLEQLLDDDYLNAQLYNFNHYIFTSKSYGRYYNGCVTTGLSRSSSRLRKIASSGLRPYLFRAAFCDDFGEYSGFESSRNLEGLKAQNDPVAHALMYFSRFRLYYSPYPSVTKYSHSLLHPTNASVYLMSIRSGNNLGFIEKKMDFTGQFSQDDLNDFTLLVKTFKNYQAKFNLEKEKYNKNYLYTNGMCLGDGLFENAYDCTKFEGRVKQQLSDRFNIDLAIASLPWTLYFKSALENKNTIEVLLTQIDVLLGFYESNTIANSAALLRKRLASLENL